MQGEWRKGMPSHSGFYWTRVSTADIEPEVCEVRIENEAYGTAEFCGWELPERLSPDGDFQYWSVMLEIPPC